MIGEQAYGPAGGRGMDSDAEGLSCGGGRRAWRGLGGLLGRAGGCVRGRNPLSGGREVAYARGEREKQFLFFRRSAKIS